jgi:hypothetical protein
MGNVRGSGVLRDSGSAIMMRQSMISRTAIGLVLIAGIGGCYYPAQIQPPPVAKTKSVVKVPYDLTWDAVHTVVNKNDFKILGDDPNHGIVEAEAHTFTLADADCGQMKSVSSRYDAEPDAGGSAVYNFKVEPAGPEASSLSVNATYSTPLHVPFHRISDFQCVSRGTQETRLLNDIAETARTERRPTAGGFAKPAEGAPGGRPTLLRSDILKKFSPPDK